MRESESNKKVEYTRKKTGAQHAGQLPGFLQNNVSQLQQVLKDDTLLSQIRSTVYSSTPTQTGGNNINLKALPDLQGKDKIKLNSTYKASKPRSSKTQKVSEIGTKIVATADSKKSKRRGSHITPRAAKRAKNIIVLR